MNRSEKNTWNAVAGKPEVRPMEEVVEALQKFVSTYHEQHGYENYSDQMFIDDILYGLGASLSEDFKFATGFAEFKLKLIKYLRGNNEEFDH